MKKVIPLEHNEQVLVVRYCDLNKIPIFAIPNGSNKSKKARGEFKAEGLRAGVPDLFIPIASKKYHGLFIEMKRIQGSVTSKEQVAWIALLNKQGYKAVICKGAAVAIDEIKEYFRESNGLHKDQGTLEFGE